MTDMLIKLYEIETQGSFEAEQKALGITLRKPIGPEKHAIIAWVFEHFGGGWASEVEVALSNQPRTCIVAVKDSKMMGFACYDATALGFLVLLAWLNHIVKKEPARRCSTPVCWI